MKLIPDWNKKLHKLWTTRLSMLGLLVGYADQALPTLQDYLPKQWYLVLFALIMIARMIAQPAANGDR